MAAPLPGGRNADPPEVALYQCFSSVDEFASALWDRSFCGVIARRNLMEPIAHLAKGLHFHLTENISGLARASLGEVYLIRNERIATDLACLFHSVFHGQAVPALPFVHAEYPNKNATYLSSAGRRRLESMLASDYYCASELERVSVC